jgi:O-acetylserine/cysteine efflux transporter
MGRSSDNSCVTFVRSDRRAALAALTAAGVLWGLSVPLTKLALDWLGPGWLTVGRFAIAAPLLALLAGPRLRAAAAPAVAAWGGLGFGAVILVQNAGIERTSVSHAALIVGVVPALVAVIAAARGRAAAGPLAWLGFALALGGVALVAGGGGGAATPAGDALVLASVTLAALAISVQPRLLVGRDPVAVTAVQLAAGAAVALPVALALEGGPPVPTAGGTVVAALVLATAGTLAPFTLFAYGQARVAPELAGAFVNLEPLVGALAGAVAFGDVFGVVQLAGGAVLLVGIALSARPARPTRVGGEGDRHRGFQGRLPARDHARRGLGGVAARDARGDHRAAAGAARGDGRGVRGGRPRAPGDPPGRRVVRDRGRLARLRAAARPPL